MGISCQCNWQLHPYKWTYLLSPGRGTQHGMLLWKSDLVLSSLPLAIPDPLPSPLFLSYPHSSPLPSPPFRGVLSRRHSLCSRGRRRHRGRRQLCGGDGQRSHPEAHQVRGGGCLAGPRDAAFRAGGCCCCLHATEAISLPFPDIFPLQLSLVIS